MDDMKRYIKGGHLVGYETIAMLRTHYQIINALEECQKKLKLPGTDKSGKVGKVMRPSIVAESAFRMTLRNTLRGESIVGRSILGKSFAFNSADMEEIDEEEEEDDEEEEEEKKGEDEESICFELHTENDEKGAKRSLSMESEEEEVPKCTEDDDDDSRWQSLKYNARGSLVHGASIHDAS